jgi:hypothetical protein
MEQVEEAEQGAFVKALMDLIVLVLLQQAH